MLMVRFGALRDDTVCIQTCKRARLAADIQAACVASQFEIGCSNLRREGLCGITSASHLTARIAAKAAASCDE
jgi:hypothetical protein